MKPLKVLVPEVGENQWKIIERALLSRVIGGYEAVKEWDVDCKCGSVHHYTNDPAPRNKLKAEQRHNLKVLIYGGEK